jgi:hypothetical protein
MAMTNQISPTGSIILGNNPIMLTRKEIKDYIYDSLNKKDYIFNWTQKQSLPYRGTLYDGTNSIDLYIYAWNITPAYRNNISEKRIQIQSDVDDIGINRPITSTQKTVILGIYNAPTEPIFTAWDPAANINHGQKSCYVQIETIAQALTDEIVKVEDKNNNSIFTFLGDYLGDYISQLQPNNSIGAIKKTIPLKQQIASKCKANRKKRTISSVNATKNRIRNLSTTEQDAIVKVRIGQGYFRDLLIEKYSCKCALCDITTRTMLYASHIKAWASCSNDSERLDENNGLLLCAHHDALFDKHLISFDSSGNLYVSKTLDANERKALNINKIPNIKLSNEMRTFMAVHYAETLKN